MAGVVMKEVVERVVLVKEEVVERVVVGWVVEMGGADDGMVGDEAVDRGIVEMGGVEAGGLSEWLKRLQ